LRRSPHRRDHRVAHLRGEPDLRPGHRERHPGRRLQDGHGDAPHAELLLLLIGGETWLAHLRQVPHQCVGVGDRVLSLRRQTFPGENVPRSASGSWAASALPTAVQCTCTRRPTSVNIRMACFDGACARYTTRSPSSIAMFAV